MTALRIRRYLDDDLVDTRELTGPLGDELGESDALWALGATEAGYRWRVVIDDPTGDRLGPAVVLEGGPAL